MGLGLNVPCARIFSAIEIMQKMSSFSLTSKVASDSVLLAHATGHFSLEKQVLVFEQPNLASICKFVNNYDPQERIFDTLSVRAPLILANTG